MKLSILLTVIMLLNYFSYSQNQSAIKCEASTLVEGQEMAMIYVFLLHNLYNETYCVLLSKNFFCSFNIENLSFYIYYYSTGFT
jgi:hypothetical protein